MDVFLHFCHIFSTFVSRFREHFCHGSVQLLHNSFTFFFAISLFFAAFCERLQKTCKTYSKKVKVSSFYTLQLYCQFTLFLTLFLQLFFQFTLFAHFFLHLFFPFTFFTFYTCPTHFFFTVVFPTHTFFALFFYTFFTVVFPIHTFFTVFFYMFFTLFSHLFYSCISNLHFFYTFLTLFVHFFCTKTAKKKCKKSVNWTKSVKKV